MNDNPSENLADGFEEWISELQGRAREIYLQLRNANLRIFNVCLNPNGLHPHNWLWIHDAKTTDQWREDIRAFLEISDHTDDDPERGRADDDVHNALGEHLRSLGYVEVSSAVSDVFEGRVASSRSRLLPDPAHEEDADGFGHYGWENGRSPPPPKSP